ncbi:ABC transporter permease [Chitinophaga vietnamensis]|uniref:ABC transporter permease n=1 Tax=Chitinophaga vietnamensis TaxID=2593957 RepID=UPI00137591A4|nr:ABC transporter permease [Chitinophaga vietnamensis]
MKLLIKTIFRQLWRQRLFTFLNILGIAIGVSACWVIYRIVSYEYNFESQLPDRTNTYRLITGMMFDQKESYSGGASAPLYQYLREEVPGLKCVVPVFGQWITTVETTDQRQQPVVADNVKNVVATDSSYFTMVPYTWVAGSPATALSAPENVVLTESRAKSYFGTANPDTVLGKIITYNKEKKRTVTGIVKDLNYPTEFTAQEIFRLPPATYTLGEWTSTDGSNRVYLQLGAGTDTAKVLAMITKVAGEKWEENLQHTQLPRSIKRWFKLMPLAESHFSTFMPEWQVRKASKPVMHGLIALGLLLIIAAGINFVNLTTAQLPQRTMSIGVRKVLGSNNGYLVKTMLGETFLIVLLAVAFSFPLTRMAYHLLGDMIPEGMFNFSTGWGFAIFIAAMLASVTLLSGAYPAWLITKVKPIAIIQGHGTMITAGSHRQPLRKILIVFQFAIAQIFIAGALIMSFQLKYTLKKDLGFNKDAVVFVEMPRKILGDSAYKNKHYVFAEALRNETGIAAVSVGREPMTEGWMSTIYEYHRQQGQEPVRHQVYKKWVDTAYLHVYDLKLLAGRNISASDTTNEFVINETAVKAFGFASPQDAIGKMIGQPGSQQFPIVGVIKDFHLRNFHVAIDPVALMADKKEANNINIRLSGTDPAKWQATLKKIEHRWHAIYPTEQWNGKFYDQLLAAMYKQERDLARLVNLATTIAIIISCLGLFGLAVVIAFQRTKEIGIRKVLGATVTGIIQMLMSDFVKLVVIALLIAAPIAWWGMSKWLQNFVYRIAIEWWMFALSGVVVIIIAMLTVGFQAVRAALVNPVKSLRSM